MGRAERTGLVVGVLALLLLTFYFGERKVSAPDNAPVILDVERFTYASIPCAINGKVDRALLKSPPVTTDTGKPLQLMDYAEKSTIAKVRELRKANKDWHTDQTCRDWDGFTQHVGIFERIVGYKERWSPSGDWRW